MYIWFASSFFRGLFGSFGLPWGHSGGLGRSLQISHGSLGVLWHSSGSLVVSWVSLSGPWGSLGGPRVFGDGPEGIENTGGSLGVSGAGVWGALGVILAVWGGP